MNSVGNAWQPGRISECGARKDIMRGVSFGRMMLVRREFEGRLLKTLCKRGRATDLVKSEKAGDF
jgi:hypothetical protein